jgi:hypothetical protein
MGGPNSTSTVDNHFSKLLIWLRMFGAPPVQKGN